VATTTITGLTAITAGNFTDAALFAVDDANSDTRKATVAQARVAIAAGAIDFQSTLDCTGVATFDSNVTVDGFLQGTTGDGYVEMRGDSGAGATQGLRLRDTGNILFGHTDGEAWDSGYRAIEFTRSAIMGATTSGSIYILANVYYDGAFKFKSTAAAGAIYWDTTTWQFNVTASGTIDTAITWVTAIQINTAGGVTFPAIGTTGSAANAFIDNTNNNNLLRSTSSLKYKADVRDLTLEESRRIVFDSKPIKYRSLAPADNGREFVGHGAEYVAEVDSRFVHFANGRPDGVMYDRYVAPLGVIAKDHEARLRALESRLVA
jgi:hypothetical protein